jgi:predicted Zn-dependent protease
VREFASYAFDDDGAPARWAWIIRAGILLRPLGGALSQAPGAGTAARPRRRGDSRGEPLEPRAHRPHGNLNVEPGDSSSRR